MTAFPQPRVAIEVISFGFAIKAKQASQQAGTDERDVVAEHAVCQLVLPEELSDMFLRVQVR